MKVRFDSGLVAYAGNAFRDTAGNPSTQLVDRNPIT